MKSTLPLTLMLIALAFILSPVSAQDTHKKMKATKDCGSCCKQGGDCCDKCGSDKCAPCCAKPTPKK